ncbi:MAG TPA: hypothetical protein VGI88_10100 [Verrucomicrobiae bacterium]
MKRIVCLFLLLQSTPALVAQTNEQPVRLAGLVDAAGMKLAIIDSKHAAAGFRGNTWLGEGQVQGKVKIVKIDSASGVVNALVAGKPYSLALKDQGEHPTPPCIDLDSVDLDVAISLYADFKSRTVLQHPQLEDRAVSMKCNLQNKAEAAAAFEKMFSKQGIATILDGDKFVMIVPFAVTNTVTPRADTIAATNAPLQALSVNFRTAPVQLVLQTYSDFVGKRIVNPDDVPGTPTLTFVQTTPLSKAQIVYALETQMAWRNFRLVPDDSGNLKCERIR